MLHRLKTPNAYIGGNLYSINKVRKKYRYYLMLLLLM